MDSATELGWCRLELMGHRVVYGVVADVEVFGARMCRVDALGENGTAEGPFQRQFYSPAAVYCVTPSTETACVAAMKRTVFAALPPADDDDDRFDGF